MTTARNNSSQWSPGAAGPVLGRSDGKITVISLVTEVLAAGGDDKDPTWWDRALCAQTDPGPFFPEKGGSTREAKRVCRNCEVRADCLEYALNHDERFGIWGGLSEQERRRLSRVSIGGSHRGPDRDTRATARRTS